MLATCPSWRPGITTLVADLLTHFAISQEVGTMPDDTTITPQYTYPIGPASELQQVYLPGLARAKKRRLNIEDETSQTMAMVRIAFRMVQVQFRYDCRMGCPRSPIATIEQVMSDELRLAFPYIWWQVRWLGLCLINGIPLTQARDLGPARTFRAQAKTLPNIPRTKWL